MRRISSLILLMTLGSPKGSTVSRRDVLGPSGDGKIIIFSDYDEEEVHEKTTSIEDVAASATVNSASIISADTDDAPAGAKNDNSDDQAPDQEADGDDGSGGDTGEL
jgi:hypothetical protein